MRLTAHHLLTDDCARNSGGAASPELWTQRYRTLRRRRALGRPHGTSPPDPTANHVLVDESCRTGTAPPAIACEIQVATRWSISVGGRADLVAQRPLSTRDPITKLNARPDRSGHSAVAVSGRASASATARLRIISRIRCANCVAPEASKEAGRLNALPRRRW